MPDTKPRLSVESEEEVPSTARGTAAESDSAGDKGAATEGGHGFSHARHATSNWLKTNFPGHENAVFGGICGLVVAMLVFAIGFWHTLFIVLCVLVGVAIGQYLDGNPTVVKFVSKFFSNNQ